MSTIPTSAIRDLQIDLIMDNPNPIIDLFNGIWKDLSVIECNVYHRNGGEYIYYNKYDRPVFFRDDQNNRFFCNNNLYWSLFKWEFNTYDVIMDDINIQYLSKVLIDNALSTNVYPVAFSNMPQSTIENALKDNIPTPTRSNRHSFIIIENAFRKLLKRLQTKIINY